MERHKGLLSDKMSYKMINELWNGIRYYRVTKGVIELHNTTKGQ